MRVSKLTIIGSDNGLSPGRHQAIIWHQCWNAVNWTLSNKLQEIFIEIHTFSFKKMHLKISFGKLWPFSLGLNVLTHWGRDKMAAIFQTTFSNALFEWKYRIKISLKFVPKGPIDNIPALVQIMAWRRPGDKPLSEPMMVSLLTHICVPRPQWVKNKNKNKSLFGNQIKSAKFADTAVSPLNIKDWLILHWDYDIPLKSNVSSMP